MDKKKHKPEMEFDYSTIPKFMQEHGKFCLWKLEMKSGKSKPDKMPYQLNGKRADATNSQHYASFNEVIDVYAKGGYAGVGIGCFEPLRLVDVDDCVVNGKLDERGQAIVNTLDSYTELSPSGNGIHIFVLDSRAGTFRMCYIQKNQRWLFFSSDSQCSGGRNST